VNSRTSWITETMTQTHQVATRIDTSSPTRRRSQRHAPSCSSAIDRARSVAVMAPQMPKGS
jgi:hypothetical protein